MQTKKKTVARLDSQYMQQYDAYIERQKKKKKRLVRRLMLFSIVFLIALGSMAAYHVKQRSVQADKQEQYVEMKDKLSTLETEEKSMKEEIDLLKDEDYVLDIARTNYFFSDKGETIFKIPDEDPSY
ncbi:septum formation initiator family protein [Lentibacillus sp. N15]|uniref:FtsB family cell division protein n=1 Tax=Lentibacillus songyuanensis TaxID=3136161 RepID=UPI0031BB1376